MSSYTIPFSYTDQKRPGVASTLTLEIASNTSTTDTYNITNTNSSALVVKQSTSSQTSWQASAGDLLHGTYVIKVFSNTS